MNKTLSSLLFAATATALSVASPRLAHAGIEACGNIDVEANANCQMEVSGGCTANCTPVSFVAACSGKLYATCESNCQLPKVNCDVNCQADCEGQCTVQPAEFDCSANCQLDCKANCDGKCSAAANHAECAAACKATCSGECDTSCSGQPATADCQGKCQASCTGQCTADTRMQCQIDCQSAGQVDCQATMKGGCEASCSEPDGALFCDGQYVDHGGNLKACEDALKAALNITVTASGSADCSGNTCAAEGQAKASCATSPVGGTSTGGAAALLAFVGLAAAGRSRRQARR